MHEVALLLGIGGLNYFPKTKHNSFLEGQLGLIRNTTASSVSDVSAPFSAYLLEICNLCQVSHTR